jgi:hypothetical protein
VGDGQLNLRLVDLGGSDSWVMINALDVVNAKTGVQSATTVLAVTTTSALSVDSSVRGSGIDVLAWPRRLSDFWPANDLLLNELVLESLHRRSMAMQDDGKAVHDQALANLFDEAHERERGGLALFIGTPPCDELIHSIQ